MLADLFPIFRYKKLVYISMSGSKVFVNEEFASGANRKIANGKN